ncbi:MAG TPA: glycosyltransferase family 9 protein [Gammaproteobacteria bacterium]|nr:glycosyltransferase family 9 protein [Gammaproteobacteria bacterium]
MAKRSILVIKHGALGDIVQAFDACASLRAGHPDDRLVLMTSPPFADPARLMPWFDEVVVDPRAGLLHVADHWRLFRLLTAGWSRIYDFQCSGRTARYFRFIIRWTGAEFVGTARGASHRLPAMEGINNRDRMLRAAELGGCPATQASLDWLKGAAEPWPDRLAVLVPGCSPAKPSKRWPAERYGELAGLLLEAGFQPAVAGTQADRAAADAIVARTPGTLDLIGKTPLPRLAGLFSAASMVVGNDTGPVFLAARCGAPTLMLMGPDTDPSMSAPVGPNASWLKVDDLSRLEPEEVLQQCKEMASSQPWY